MQQRMFQKAEYFTQHIAVQLHFSHQQFAGQAEHRSLAVRAQSGIPQHILVLAPQQIAPPELVTMSIDSDAATSFVTKYQHIHIEPGQFVLTDWLANVQDGQLPIHVMQLAGMLQVVDSYFYYVLLDFIHGFPIWFDAAKLADSTEVPRFHIP